MIRIELCEGAAQCLDIVPCRCPSGYNEIHDTHVISLRQFRGKVLSVAAAANDDFFDSASGVGGVHTLLLARCPSKNTLGVGQATKLGAELKKEGMEQLVGGLPRQGHGGGVTQTASELVMSECSRVDAERQCDGVCFATGEIQGLLRVVPQSHDQNVPGRAHELIVVTIDDLEPVEDLEHHLGYSGGCYLSENRWQWPNLDLFPPPIEFLEHTQPFHTVDCAPHLNQIAHQSDNVLVCRRKRVKHESNVCISIVNYRF